MREPIRDRGRLEHILAAINYIETFSQGRTEEELSSDKMLFFAIVKNIEIIGEAVYKLSKLFREKHADVPWAYIEKMRHVLVHDYYRINSKEVWQVITVDLPPLRDQIRRMVEGTDWGAWEQLKPAF